MSRSRWSVWRSSIADPEEIAKLILCANDGERLSGEALRNVFSAVDARSHLRSTCLATRLQYRSAFRRYVDDVFGVTTAAVGEHPHRDAGPNT